jgi:hypothetical protein
MRMIPKKGRTVALVIALTGPSSITLPAMAQRFAPFLLIPHSPRNCLLLSFSIFHIFQLSFALRRRFIIRRLVLPSTLSGRICECRGCLTSDTNSLIRKTSLYWTSTQHTESTVPQFIRHTITFSILSPYLVSYFHLRFLTSSLEPQYIVALPGCLPSKHLTWQQIELSIHDVPLN